MSDQSRVVGEKAGATSGLGVNESMRSGQRSAAVGTARAEESLVRNKSVDLIGSAVKRGVNGKAADGTANETANARVGREVASDPAVSNVIVVNRVRASLTAAHATRVDHQALAETSETVAAEVEAEAPETTEGNGFVTPRTSHMAN